MQKLTIGVLIGVGAIVACSPDAAVHPDSVVHRDAQDLTHENLQGAMRASRGAEDRILAIDQATGALGGMYFDSSGALVVSVLDAPGASDALAAAAGVLKENQLLAVDERGSQRRVRWIRARYRFSELVMYQAIASQVLRGMEEITHTDANEKTNRLTVGVEKLSRTQAVMLRLASAGIPLAAVEVVQRERMQAAASVRDRFRPTGGGVQVWAPHLASPICSLGYNVWLNGQRYLLTNSHCVGNRDGNAIGFSIYQNTASGANLVGQVAVDPPWTVSDPGCSVSTCRRSDAALVLYATGIAAPSQVAKTTNVGTGSAGSLTFASWLTVIDPLGNEPYVGLQNIYKVGRTSGTTQGSVVESCVNVAGIGFSVLCSDIVQAWADLGDSGSPVFWFPLVLAPQNRIPMGVLYGVRTGASGAREYAFSRLSQIATELGPLVYH